MPKTPDRRDTDTQAPLPSPADTPLPPPPTFEEVTRYIETHRSAPRDVELAARFVAQQVGGEPFLLYGAGTHTQALLDAFARQGFRPNLAGILDRRVEGPFLGYPVHRPERIRDLASQATRVVLSHHEYEHTMRRALDEAGNPLPVLAIYTNPDFARLASGVEIPLRPAADRPRVLVASVGERAIASDDLFRRLRPQWWVGRCYANRGGITGDPSAYDAVFDCRQSVTLLARAIESTRPDLVYVIDHYSQGNFLPAWLHRRFAGLRVVGEFYDFLRFTFDDPTVLSRELHFTPEDVALMVWGEDQSRLLDGVVTKERGAPLTDFLAGTRALYFGQYVPAALQTFREHTTPGSHLVFPGAVNRSANPSALFGDNQLLGIFGDLIRLGHHIHLYLTVPTRQDVERHYPEYVDLASRTGRLHISPQRPLAELLPAIAGFDYGIVLGHFTDEIRAVNRIRIRTTFPSKLYTFVAAGLPVLLNELEAAGDWVEEQGIGRRIRSLEEIGRITPAEYASMKEAVRRLQDSLTLEAQEDRFRSFLAEILHSAPGGAS